MAWHGPAQDGVEVRVGDCVELAPAPGEEETRLARVQALWAEAMPDGRERMLAKCTRFYRPQVRACGRPGMHAHAQHLGGQLPPVPGGAAPMAKSCC
jgi:hypothetical protein